MNFGVIILNYIAYATTIECVDSFIKQDCGRHSVQIVIVDNASPNSSYHILQKHFESVDNIHVISTDVNIGFANGNNIGYKTLLNFIDPDFVIISNDDILLKQEGLYNWIEQKYKETNFAVLGPSVFSTRGMFYQSPVANHSNKKGKCIYDIFRLDISIIAANVRKVFKIPIKVSDIASIGIKAPKDDCDSMTLHGSFQVFSKMYFTSYKEPYDPRTFLYLEEDILRLRCDQKSLTMLFSPEYEVNHLQAVATNLVATDNYMRIINRLCNLRKSYKVFLKVLNEK